jgi:hypothetical protein
LVNDSNDEPFEKNGVPIMTQHETLPEKNEPHRGPSLMAVAIVHVALFSASLVACAVMTGGGHFPSPFAPKPLAAAFFSNHADAVRIGAFLQFGAAVPLAVFCATCVSRLGFLGIRAAGPTIALVGGSLASAMAAMSGLLQWLLAQPGISSNEELLHAVHFLSFATGGPGYVVPFGLLVAGVSVSAGLTRNLPRWIMWFGIGVAAVAELSALTIATPIAAYLLPVARFPGFVWLIMVGVTLASTRAPRTTPSGESALRVHEDGCQNRSDERRFA